MADGYDEDLAEAIRRSLLDQGEDEKPIKPEQEDSGQADSVVKRETTQEPPPIVILDSDDEDNKELVKQAIKKEEQEDFHQEMAKSTTVQQKGPASMLGLDRAQMERERLSRMKRKSSDDLQTSQPQSKRVGSVPTGSIRGVVSGEAGHSTFSSSVASSSFHRPQGSPFMTMSDLQARVSNYVPQNTRYLEGVVKKTYIQGRPRSSDDIKLEEVLQTNTLQSAVLSAFTWDLEWLISKVKFGECDLVLVFQAKGEQIDEYRSVLCRVPRTRVCFPDMSGNINCMHSKLQLLFHLTHLRVVIPTANLTPYDWGEAIEVGGEGVMENSVFIIDFPELPKTSISDNPNPTHTQFSRQLIRFCKAKGIPEDIINRVNKEYDFTKSQRIGFVYSIGGSHHGKAALRNGICGLANTIKVLGMNTKKPLEVDYVTSSVGSLNKEFLLRMFRAVHGDDGRKNVKVPKADSRRIADPQDETTESESEEDLSDDQHWQKMQGSLRVYFPSRSTVAASKGGIQNGGTICFQRKWFDSSTFPRSLLHDCKSVRPRMLMHNKIIFVRLSTPRANAQAWAYIGSANLSESAWGKLIWDRQEKDFKVTTRNWECGVIMPVTAPDGREQGDTDPTEAKSSSTPDMDVFRDVVPVPMSTPALRLTSDNPPWYFGELRGNP